MAIIMKAEEAFEDDVKSFPGLLSAFLYSDLDYMFADLVQTRWVSLHDLTGNEILVLVPATIQSKVIISDGRARLLRPFRYVGTRSVNMMTRIVGEHFGISLRYFPCMVFFDHPASREVYCFSFRAEKSVEELADAIKEVIGLAREAVVERSIVAGAEEELREQRAELLQRLVPRLRQAKVFRHCRRLTVNKAISNLARIGAGLI